LATRRKDRRSRSRKPRPKVESAGASALSTDTHPQQTPKKRKARDRAGAQASNARADRSRIRKAAVQSVPGDDRPQAPWHPLPLSEILILVGAIGTIIGLRHGLTHGSAPLFAGIGAVAIGTVEVMLREHRGGYRSHTIVLALLPVIILHTAVVLIVSAYSRIPQALNIGLLAVDIALFVLLFRFLRARFIDAHRDRVFKGRRTRG